MVSILVGLAFCAFVPAARSSQFRIGGSFGIEAMALDAHGDAIVAVPIPTTKFNGTFAVVKLSGTTGVERWRHPMTGTGREHSDSAHALALDTARDVLVAAGIEYDGRVQFTVAKLSGATGETMWLRRVHGDVPAYEDEAFALAVDPNGDVVAGGRLTNITAPSNYGNYAVVKLSGADGAEVWRYVQRELTVLGGTATGVAIDGAGDVLAVGDTAVRMPSIGSSAVVTAVKLDRRTGHELWRRDMPNAWRTSDVAVTAAGDTLLALGFADTKPVNEFGVAKLSAATGEVLWEGHVSESDNSWQEAFRVALDPRGDVVAAGLTQTPETHEDFAVAKFNGATGAEQWRRVINGTANGHDFARGLVVDSEGDVIAVGSLENVGTCYDFIVTKLSGATGEVLWLESIDGTAVASVCDVECEEHCQPPPRAGIDQDAGSAIGLDGSGRIVVGGILSNLHQGAAHQDTTLIRSSDRVSGRYLRMVHGGSGDRLSLLSTDSDILAPSLTTLQAPTQAGAMLTVTNNDTGESQSFSMPADKWTARRVSPPGAARYQYDDSMGPCKRVIVQSGRLLMVQCEGTGISSVLARPGTARIAAEMTLGTGARFCMAFAGAVRAARGGATLVFRAANASPPAECPK